MATRRSLLQAKILIVVIDRPAPSVSYLSDAVGTTREATSRAVRTLVQQGLVHKKGRVVHPTTAAYGELTRLREQWTYKAALAEEWERALQGEWE